MGNLLPFHTIRETFVLVDPLLRLWLLLHIQCLLQCFHVPGLFWVIHGLQLLWSPMAVKTCEASSLVDEHAEPVDAAIPLVSRWSMRDSPIPVNPEVCIVWKSFWFCHHLDMNLQWNSGLHLSICSGGLWEFLCICFLAYFGNWTCLSQSNNSSYIFCSRS